MSVFVCVAVHCLALACQLSSPESKSYTQTGFRVDSMQWLSWAMVIFMAALVATISLIGTQVWDMLKQGCADIQNCGIKLLHLFVCC